MRNLRKYLDVGLPMLGVIVILSTVLFLRDIRAQIAVIMIGIILIEAGVWKLAHQLLPNDRRYHALRTEIDHFITLSRQLNETSILMKLNNSSENQLHFEDLKFKMHEVVENISEVAGKTDENSNLTKRDSNIHSKT